MAVDGGLDVYMNNTAPVAGFQFNVLGITLTGASGGSASDAGFNVSTGNNTVLGFSMIGATIPAGDGLLTSLVGVFNAEESCIVDLILAVDAEGMIIQSTGECVPTGWVESIPGCTDEDACNYNSEATDDDGSCAVEDCAGECGGAALVDECGVCDGSGAEEGHDCDGNCVDAGICGSATLSFANVTSGSADIIYNSNVPIYGFGRATGYICKT
jgi:hypothetical protein